MNVDELAKVADAIAERIEPGAVIAVSTGSGCSKESGVPTFRGKDGIWEKHRAEDVCTIDVLRRDPAFYWRFHDSLRETMLSCEPNAAHYTIAEMERTLSETCEFGVITQNIDRMHQRAGSKRVAEVHGDALSFHCMGCRRPVDDVPYPCAEYPPHCDNCGGVIRPDIVLFGEMLPEDALGQAQYLACTADVFLSVGTSVIVQPAASLPFLALQSGALVVEINPNPTALTGFAQFTVHGTAAAVLPTLWGEVVLRL